MSFEDMLRNQTKTKQELYAERQTQLRQDIEYMAGVFVEAFKFACEGAASAGHRSMYFPIPFFVHKEVLEGKQYSLIGDETAGVNKRFIYS